MNLTTNAVSVGIRGLCFVVLLTACALISGALAQRSSGGGGGKVTFTSVTSTVFDLDTSGVPLLFKSDDYGGSGEATYSNVNNVGIGTSIDSNNVWYLNLYGQTTGARVVYITPNDPVGTQPAAPPANYYWKNVEITSKCTDFSGTNVPWSSLVNGSSSCTFGIDFNYNGIVYKLLIGRLLNPTDPPSGHASVACNGVNSSNKCVAGTITAGSGTSPVIANLYSDTGKHSPSPWVFIGQYYNSVRVSITNP